MPSADPVDTVREFDALHLGWYYQNKTLYGTWGAYACLLSRTSLFFRHQPVRVEKAFRLGVQTVYHNRLCWYAYESMLALSPDPDTTFVTSSHGMNTTVLKPKDVEQGLASSAALERMFCLHSRSVGGSTADTHADLLDQYNYHRWSHDGKEDPKDSSIYALVISLPLLHQCRNVYPTIDRQLAAYLSSSAAPPQPGVFFDTGWVSCNMNWNTSVAQTDAHFYPELQVRAPLGGGNERFLDVQELAVLLGGPEWSTRPWTTWLGRTAQTRALSSTRVRCRVIGKPLRMETNHSVPRALIASPLCHQQLAVCLSTSSSFDDPSVAEDVAVRAAQQLLMLYPAIPHPLFCTRDVTGLIALFVVPLNSVSCRVLNQRTAPGWPSVGSVRGSVGIGRTFSTWGGGHGVEGDMDRTGCGPGTQGATSCG